MSFIPQKSDNKRFLEDQLKVEIVFNKDTNKNHEIVTGLLLDGKRYREDQKNNCVYVAESAAEEELQFLKMDEVSDEELNSLIKSYEIRIQEIKEFYTIHEWDGDDWQPEYTKFAYGFYPQTTDDDLFLKDQLVLFKAGRDYHQSIKDALSAIKVHVNMEDIQKNIQIKTKIISWYNKRIKAVEEFLSENKYNVKTKCWQKL